MSTVDGNRAKQLRAELKEWEHSFAAEHGRKPSREEVKRDPHVSAKYKEYSKLRTSSTASRPTTSNPKPKPEHTPSTTKGIHDPFASAKSDKSTASTRKKAADIFKTPTKPQSTSADRQEIYDSPLSLRRTRLFGNRPRDSVGPTPQKTGKVLGLFESFVDIEATPKIKDRISASPASTRKAGDASEEGANVGGEFATPRKRKAEEISVGSANKREEEEFTTPSFLRRDSSRFQPPTESPPVPLPMRPIRGLSSMVAELRKMENEAIEEEFADDEEAMKEMEMLDGEPSLPLPKKQRDEEVGVGMGDLPPGAFAEEAIVDEDDGEDKDRPKWKKKGLKRQTKRTISNYTPPNTNILTHRLTNIVRPITTKSREVPQEEDAPPNPADVELPPAGYDDDEDLSNIESEDEHTSKKAMVDKGKTVVKKVVRKVKATANANFRRLNIRGQGTKARGGGKFRRRR